MMRGPKPEFTDFSQYPDLVVIYLGMYALTWRGTLNLLKTGPEINKAVAEKPDGLLKHEQFVMGIFPLHLGMRQYWRDFDALERWSRSNSIHMGWWKSFMSDPAGKGTAFWHEAYSMQGSMEAVYINVNKPLGAKSFAPAKPATGTMFSARRRLGRSGEHTVDIPLPEENYAAGD